MSQQTDEAETNQNNSLHNGTRPNITLEEETTAQKSFLGELKVMAWNVGSLFDKIILQGICEFIGAFDVVCLAETFTLPSFDFNVKFGDFVAVHWPAERFSSLGRPSGGLVVLYRKTLAPYVQVIKTNISHVICLRISKTILKSTKDLLYISTYVHPSNSIFYSNKEYDNTLDMLEDFVSDEQTKDENINILINGDLNARVGDWSYSHPPPDCDQEDEEIVYHRTAQDSQYNPNGKKLIEICNTLNLTPINGLTEKNFDNNFTFISKRGNSTIDHYLCSPDLLPSISKYRIINRLESQHLPITLNVQANTENLSEDKKQGEIKKITWKETKSEECKNILQKEETKKLLHDAETATDNGDIEQSVSLFTKLMQLVSRPLEHVLKIGGTKLDRKPWFDKECQRKKKETLKLLNKLSKLDNKRQPRRYQREKNIYLQKKMEYQRLTKNKRKIYNQQAKEKLIKDSKDSKSFWATIRKLNGKKHTIPNIPITTWFEHYDELLNFSSSTGREDEDTPQTQENVLVEELDQQITDDEVNKALTKLKANKSPGEDEIIAEVLQCSKDGIFSYLCKTFNKIFELGYFPIQWGLATIVPIYKKGDRDTCDNYRGISLLSVTSKFFSSIINTRLYKWAETNSKINEEQAGFRKSYSTIDHIYTLHCMASNCLYGSKRSKLYAAFIDFRKAFDTVNRDKLWETLIKIGVSTKMINLLKAMYTSVKAIVKQGYEKSAELNCPRGVRQGCILSPLLFSLLVAEVAYQVAGGGRAGYQLIPGAQEIFALLFADDVVLLSLTPIGLQTQINNLKKAAETLGLIVNLDKSKILVYRKGGFLGRQERWFFGREPIEVVNNYKYLGYTMTTKLSIEIPLAEFAGRAKNKIISIFKTLYRLGKVDPEIFFKLFDAQIKPMALYAAEIWGLASEETLYTIEKIHMYACKKLLGVTARTPNTLVQAELNRYPIIIDAKIRALKYWFKLLTLEDNRLPKQAYLRELKETSKTENWTTKIRHLLATNGYLYVWNNNGTLYTKAFCRGLKQRLIDQFWQNWHSELFSSDRYDFFRTIKDNHSLEHYVTAITINKFRKALARFRMGIVDIRNNERFLRPLSSRNCIFCQPAITDDESHFLFDCPIYHDIREKYLKKCWITLKNLTVKDVIANESTFVLKQSSMYIYHALKFRQSQVD